MKVLHVLASSAFSGAENVACQIIKLCENEGIVSAYASVDGSIRMALDERGIMFYPLQTLSVGSLKKVIKEFNPDIIHAHDMKASFVASLCKGKINIVSHIHNNNYNSRKLSIKSILYLYATRRINKIIWVSEDSRNGYYFRNKVSEKSYIVENIIDIDEIERKKNMDKREYDYQVVYLGRLAPEKNIQRLIDIISIVKKEIPQIKVALVGSGILEDALKKEVYSRNMEDNIKFLGFSDNPYKILSCARVMVMTSLWEGLPMCVLEGQALGVPIVSTPVGGIGNVVIEEETGYLTSDNEVFAKRIIELTQDNELQHRLSQNAASKSSVLNNKLAYIKKITDMYMDK